LGGPSIEEGEAPSQVEGQGEDAAAGRRMPPTRQRAAEFVDPVRYGPCARISVGYRYGTVCNTYVRIHAIGNMHRAPFRAGPGQTKITMPRCCKWGKKEGAIVWGRAAASRPRSLPRRWRLAPRRPPLTPAKFRYLWRIATRAGSSPEGSRASGPSSSSCRSCCCRCCCWSRCFASAAAVTTLAVRATRRAHSALMSPNRTNQHRRGGEVAPELQHIRQQSNRGQVISAQLVEPSFDPFAAVQPSEEPSCH
jgi:hypothetical protein